jgi:hypothetical protein
MPARRDYADAWRDTWATLAQVPIAGLLATDYFCQQWVERSSTYLSHVSARLALARPAAAVAGPGGESADNVMADVFSEDLAEATRGLVRDLVSLPGQTASFFNAHLEDLINQVLIRIQPDAQNDVRTFVINELEKLNRDLLRLREVASAEAARRGPAPRAGRARALDERHALDNASLQDLLKTIKKVADEALEESQGGRRGGRESAPHERLPRVIQAIVHEALTRFAPETPGPSARPATPGLAQEQATRLLLALRHARDKLELAQRDIKRVGSGGEAVIRLLLAMQSARVELEHTGREIDDERKGAARPRARREIARTRR